MAKAAEAAAEVGGEDAYWEMHAWLLRNQDDFTQALLMQQLPRMEFDPRAFTTAMNSAAVANAISEDASAAKRMGLRSIPFFWVNGQRVPRWKLEGERVPERIIEIALEEARNAN
jgi:protein-disulfide isomerase